ncbi:MAG: DUF3570 domain-containing protein [Gammaproteobacteria bacterium]|nr:DUF3570 domain-containing protein [Gammaproteobacteria bacterium]
MVVTKVQFNICAIIINALIGLLMIGRPVFSAALPEDRADIQYHYYDGGGVEVDGATVLVRKSFANKFSVYGKYHQDSITAASPDVLAGASKYSEDRDEYTIGGNYLYDNTLMSTFYTYSDENDYEANTAGFDISHDMFGDLTTVSLGFTYGWDTIMRVDAPEFEEDLRRTQYRASISQVLTSKIKASLSYEAIIEDGFINNPYRFVIIGNVPQGLGSEVYPGTRTSQATAVRATKYWDFKGATSLGYRYFRDTWDIVAHTVDFTYSQYFGERWLTDLYLRYYTQDAADFYSNNFAVAQNYMARDKELSSFDSHSIGGKISYKIFNEYSGFNNGTLNFSAEYIDSQYDDYSGIEDLSVITDDTYSFDAAVLQLFFSVRY